MTWRDWLGAAAFAWEAARGYRFRPWRSPYLRWRIETYWGLPAEGVGRRDFLDLFQKERSRLLQFAQWAARERRR